MVVKRASEIEEISNVIRRDETSDVDSMKGKMKLKTILLKIINKQLYVSGSFKNIVLYKTQ